MRGAAIEDDARRGRAGGPGRRERGGRVMKRWDRDREQRARERRARDEEDERRAATERRGEQLREAWRKHHPREGRDEPKRKKP